jgi:hypothetical protein
MKTYVHSWLYLPQFLLECEMFQTKVVEIRTQILCSVFFRKSYCLWDNVGKMVESDRPQMTVQRTRFACWITKATEIHTQNMKYLLLFHSNSGYANAPCCYVYTYVTSLVLITVIFCEGWRLWRLSLNSFLRSPVCLLTTGPGILLSIPFVHILELYSSLIPDAKFPTHTVQQVLFFVIRINYHTGNRFVDR